MTTEKEYLDILRDRLTGYLSGEDLEEILDEYAGHFAIGKSRGRTEEELAESLGDPDEVAKEVRAAYLIHKAEQNKSAGTIWQATKATTHISGLSRAAVIVPVILCMVVFGLVFIAGLAMVCGGAVLLLLAILKFLGLSLAPAWHLTPEPGVLAAIGIFCLGIIIIAADIWLAHFVGPLCGAPPERKTPGKERCRDLFPGAGPGDILHRPRQCLRTRPSRSGSGPANSPLGAGTGAGRS